MKKLILTIGFSGLLLACNANNSSRLNSEALQEEKTIFKIQNFLVTSIEGMEPQEIRSSIVAHYKTLGLMDQSGQWVRDEFNQLSGHLLPELITAQDLEALVKDAAKNLDNNVYLNAFLKEAGSKQFTLMSKASTPQGQKELQDVIPFAFALQQLTVALRQDMGLLEVVQDVWAKRREFLGVGKVSNLFEKAKLYSVEYCIDNVIKFHKEQEVDPRFLKFMLPLNIVEANLEDSRKGMRDNASAGWQLSNSYPGKLCPEGVDCDARFTDDGHGLLISLPEPKAYADLYQTWNMAFVTNYDNFPYFLAKLTIPQVSSYEKDPRAYIYNRALALYAFMHFELFGRFETKPEGKMSWRDPEMQKLWGKCNKHNASENYEKLLHSAKTVNAPSCG